MSNEELQALLAYWRRILRLEDWTVSVRFSRRHELNYAGLCTTWAKLMTSEIQILDPIDHIPHTLFDVEQTLVHEMLHIRFSYLDKEWNDAHLVLYEQAIEQMAWSYVRLNRGQR